MWMSGKLIFLALFCFIQTGNAFTPKQIEAVNGGSNCVACTVIVGLVEQLASINNQTIEQSLDKFCNYFPAGLFQYSCKEAVEIFGSVVINGYVPSLILS